MKSVTIYLVVQKPEIREWQFCVGRRTDPTFVAYTVTAYLAIKRLLKQLDVKIIEKDWKD